jgi:hypothetical protein
MLTTAEHQDVAKQTRQARNAAAKARRAAPVHILRCAIDDRVELLAVSRSHPQVAYLLRPGPDGKLTCSCTGYRWRQACAHVLAAAAYQPRQSETDQ